jgi:hypothetical protein
MSMPQLFSLSRYYYLSWYMLIAAFTLLVITSHIVPIAMILIVGFISCLMIYIPSSRLAPYSRIIRLLIGLFLTTLLAFEVRNYRNLEHGIRIMIELILGALPLTLITFRDLRSYWLSILNITVIAIGSIALGESFRGFIAFLIFVLTLVLSLNAANLYLYSKNSPGETAPDTLPRHYLWHILQAIPAGLITALIIFFAFPRAHNFSLGISAGTDRASTGFSGLIDLRSKGGIDRSQALALLLQSENSEWLRENEQNILLRGTALHSFNGEKWTASFNQGKVLAPSDSIPLAKNQKKSRHFLKIQTEHHNHKYLFYPDVLLSVNERPGALGTLLTGPDGSLTRTETEITRFEYSISTSPRIPITEMLEITISDLASGHPPAIAELSHIDHTLKESPWFQKWLKEIAIDPRDNIASLEKKLIAYFSTNYLPTLTSDHSSEDPLREFLTSKRQGHCEYFATATTLYLKSIGIAARVVVGYRGGVYNKLIDALEVRNDHAHAWTEYWIPEYGWYPMDTTPYIHQSDGLTSSITLFFNAIQYWFRKYFIDYDHGTQKELMQALQNMAKQSTAKETWRWDVVLSWIKKNIFLITIIVVCLIFSWRIKMRKKRNKSWPSYYQNFILQVERLGFKRHTGETLQKFHHRILTAHHLPETIRETVTKVDKEIERDLYKMDPS